MNKNKNWNEVVNVTAFMRWLLNCASKEDYASCVKYLFDGSEEYDTEDSIKILAEEHFSEIYDMLVLDGDIEEDEPEDDGFLAWCIHEEQKRNAYREADLW